MQNDVTSPDARKKFRSWNFIHHLKNSKIVSRNLSGGEYCDQNSLRASGLVHKCQVIALYEVRDVSDVSYIEYEVTEIVSVRSIFLKITLIPFIVSYFSYPSSLSGSPF